MCPLGDPCPSLYIVKGQSYKQSILFGTISCSFAVHADQRRAPHVFILWAEPPLMVRPMSTHEGIRVYTPTASAVAGPLSGVTVPAVGSEGVALERRRGCNEDKDRADVEEEELADASVEPKEMRVLDHLAVVVPHPHELHHPDARIHRHPLPRKGLHRDASPDRSQQFPQATAHELPSLSPRCRRKRWTVSSAVGDSREA